jgi:hypothetical protein
MLTKLYGIDFNKYICGGIGNAKLGKIGNETILFYTESEMLKALAELKESGNTVGEINVFTTPIVRTEYEI